MSNMDVDSPRASLHQKVLQLSGLEVAESAVSGSLSVLLQKCSLQLPHDVLQRVEPYIWIETNKERVEQCILEKSFKKLKLLEKTGASPSWIMFATLFKQPVAIKITALPLDVRSILSASALDTERTIYETVINSLLFCGFTPHVLVFYATLNCDAFINHEKQRNKDVKALIDQMQDADFSDLYDPQKMRASVIERATGGTLTELFKRINLNNEHTFNNVFAPLLFQIFYTLAVFAEVGLIHNDLHAGNIFIEESNEPSTNFYRVNGKFYAVSSTKQVRIFDFDRNSKIPTSIDERNIENSGLFGHCPRYGQCNALNEQSELYTLVNSLHHYNGTLQNEELQDFIIDVVPDDLLERFVHGMQYENQVIPTIPGTTLAFAGRLCICNDINCSSCTAVKDPRIKTPKKILEKREFEQFQIASLPENAFVWRLPSESSSLETFRQLNSQ